MPRWKRCPKCGTKAIAVSRREVGKLQAGDHPRLIPDGVFWDAECESCGWSYQGAAGLTELLEVMRNRWGDVTDD